MDRRFRILLLVLARLQVVAVIAVSLPPPPTPPPPALTSVVPPPTGRVNVDEIAVESGCMAPRLTSSEHVEVPFHAFMPLPFTDALRDSGGFWDPAQPTRLTAPVDGNYLMGGSIRWHHHENVCSGFRNLGSAGAEPRTPASATTKWVSTEFVGAYGLQEISTYFPLKAGEWVEL